ncbi:multidrug ABC transporter ATP-binding protein [Bacterioplanes sanyensis]|uniref:Multidrug ABC transporter ATP-binding protein n=1 Tax=Bacterioplanes sanyensis TaxID=1249553 RepID=A0A222FMV6_9GAMM|nr:ABC transporter ATP-binding protein [Bacterioplanes sanyensis]ASP39854.1 multidrug ABC transporter ATP-binding protein [Bacterioplanes sanyensis]
MNALVQATQLRKSFGKSSVLNGIDLTIEAGQIVGLIGPNGAGKTTLLRCLLGLTEADGELSVLGQSPWQQREKMLQQLAYIPDTAILPRWISVEKLLTYMQGVHPRFDPERARSLLDTTDVPMNKKIGQLSKGMVTQVHLALVMAIDAQLLVLDEPTLGLDILYRRQFYQRLLEDYYDQERTIIITTHQVDEIEDILTHAAFVRRGELVLQSSIEDLQDNFRQLTVKPAQLEAARALNPVSEQTLLGASRLLMQNCDESQLQALGDVGLASLSDVFVALMQQEYEK